MPCSSVHAIQRMQPCACSPVPCSPVPCSPACAALCHAAQCMQPHAKQPCACSQGLCSNKCRLLCMWSHALRPGASPAAQLKSMPTPSVPAVAVGSVLNILCTPGPAAAVRAAPSNLLCLPTHCRFAMHSNTNNQTQLKWVEPYFELAGCAYVQICSPRRCLSLCVAPKLPGCQSCWCKVHLTLGGFIGWVYGCR